MHHFKQSSSTDGPVCHAHQINGGEEEATVSGDTATIMFELTGPDAANLATEFRILLQEINPDDDTGTVLTDITCATASSADPPFTVTCDFDPGKVLYSNFNVHVVYSGTSEIGTPRENGLCPL